MANKLYQSLIFYCKELIKETNYVVSTISMFYGILPRDTTKTSSPTHTRRLPFKES